MTTSHRTCAAPDGVGTGAATRRALLLGATGLVGSILLGRLLADARYREVIVVARRSPALVHPALRVVEVDFERLASAAEAFRVEHVYCCLGTTLKRAGSRDAFRRVDHDYVVEAARLAAAADVEAFVWMSSVGADPASRSFYTRVKGELERAVAALPLRRWIAVRPSLLLGDRAEFRPAERITAVLSRPLGPLLVGGLRRWRPIAAEAVAQSMLELANGGAAVEGLEYVAGGTGAAA